VRVRELDLESDEVSEWARYFSWYDYRPDKTDWYMSQLAGFSSGKPSFRISEFYHPSIGGSSAIISAKEATGMVRSMYGKS